MFLASEGYLWELTQRGEPITPAKLEKDFSELLDFWKSVYYKLFIGTVLYRWISCFIG